MLLTAGQCWDKGTWLRTADVGFLKEKLEISILCEVSGL